MTGIPANPGEPDQAQRQEASLLYRTAARIRELSGGNAAPTFAPDSEFSPAGEISAREFLDLLLEAETPWQRANLALRCATVRSHVLNIVQHSSWAEFGESKLRRDHAIERVRRTMLGERRMIPVASGLPPAALSLEALRGDSRMATVRIYRPVVIARAGHTEVNPDTKERHRHVACLAEEDMFLVNLNGVVTTLAAEGQLGAIDAITRIPQGRAVTSLLARAIHENLSHLIIPVKTLLVLERRYPKEEKRG
jgi:hypothetical protein